MNKQNLKHLLIQSLKNLRQKMVELVNQMRRLRAPAKSSNEMDPELWQLEAQFYQEQDPEQMQARQLAATYKGGKG
jgi:cytoplasmic iron level regulating protein YaaA (DUF328/UPF0246 family)